ncbi:LysE family translocator [Marinobacter hydrocarbonoclasticus]|uniref:LysE family translocator n=1 Tax=Marinobacter nauticus TaxID=2743 RepID=UPI001C95896D|nr:LysE family translocator [Marinobacter nauticus]MBY6193733.1 LysE family translocator [Marinobacter nauticus]MBY6214881.1 LysE family translocator [Marinobacter nauticus]
MAIGDALMPECKVGFGRKADIQVQTSRSICSSLLTNESNIDRRLMIGIENFGAFLIASIALNLVPGPDTFYILGRSLAQGRGVGVASSLGISAGALVHTFAAAIGLSALLTASATAFLAIKLLGAAYLVYLGLSMIFKKATQIPGDNKLSNDGVGPAFRQGLITNTLNPKVALFFLAFLPQFIAQDADSHLLGFVSLGLTFVVTSTVWGIVLAWSSAALSGGLRRNPRYLVYLNKVTGTLLVGLGVRLATSTNE